jgi:rhodanese-related sulfurtransferase
MKRFQHLIDACLPLVREIFPWDLCDLQQSQPDSLLLDVREPYEFQAMRIKGSLNVPRGILETACEYGYEETVPELAAGRDREIVVICRSGNRSVLAARTMQELGFERVCSLKTGLRGWNDYQQPLVDHRGRRVHEEEAERYFTPKLRPEQLDRR